MEAPSLLPPGDTAASLLAKVQARNRLEVGAFRAVFEAHAAAQRQARALQERVNALQRENAELSEGKETAETNLKTASEAAARGAAAQEQSARVAELQAELAASYKQHADSSQQVIAAKEKVAEAEAEVAATKEALAVAERERDEARARGSTLEAELELSRAAAEAAATEAEARLAGRDEALARAEKLEAENANLVERIMEMKMQEAEKMNLTGGPRGGYFPARKRLAIRANAGGTHRLAFTPGGDVLATAGDDKIVALWDAGTGQPTGPERLVGATGALLDVDISGDGGGDMCVLGAGTDRAVRLWDAATGRVRHTMTGHADKVCAARFCPWETNRAVSCSHDRTIKVWDLAKGYAVASIMCASNCNSATYGDGASTVVSGHFDGAARVWDLRQKSALDPSEIKAHAQHVTAVTMMPTSGSQFITSSRDNTLALVDLRGGSGEKVRTLKASGYRSGTQWASPGIAPDGRHVAAGGADGAVFVWNVHDGGLKATLRGHDAAVATCAWGQSGLASADKNGAAIFWGE